MSAKALVIENDFMIEGNTPKERINCIMIHLLEVLEDMEINDGNYLKFANLFKSINLDLDELIQCKKEITKNTYYRRFIQNPNRRRPLTYAQKLKDSNYYMCDCGRPVHTQFTEEHLVTLVHKNGIKNREYTFKTKKNDKLKHESISFLMSREILLENFCLKHIKTINS